MKAKKKNKMSINQRGAKALLTNQSAMQHLVAIKVGSKVEVFEFPTKAKQMGFVEDLRKEFPELQFCYSTEETKE